MRNCRITVSSGMTDATYAMLCEKAQRRFGADLSFTRVNDDGVIAGFILELDGTVYDMTVNTRLDQAKHAFDAERTVEA